MRFLALGDSYTIGEGVAEVVRWPNQLVNKLGRYGIPIEQPTIIARTGWTTDELRAGIHQAHPQGIFELVSLLIGVNNQYRGCDLNEYKVDFRKLLNTAIGFAGENPTRVIVLSIPDWGATTYAEGIDRVQIGIEIDAFNSSNHEITLKLGARYINIPPITRAASHDRSLIASDGLHPSGKMYKLWTRSIFPDALKALNRR